MRERVIVMITILDIESIMIRNITGVNHNNIKIYLKELNIKPT